MDSQGQKMHVASPGHEIHLCHRCKWPFPNPHPSARHRRAHKKVCGTIEGFKSDLAISDDEHESNDEHTPSPKLEKRIMKEPSSFDGVGEKSNKSEDVYSDAKTDFSESSPGFDDFFEIFKGQTQKSPETDVKDDVNNSQMSKVDLSLVNKNDGNASMSPAANLTNVEDKSDMELGETVKTKAVSAENVDASKVGEACSLGTGLAEDLQDDRTTRPIRDDTIPEEVPSKTGKCANGKESEFVGTVSREEQTYNICSTGKVLMVHSSSPSDSQVLLENSINDKKIHDNVPCDSSSSLQDKGDGKGVRERDSISTTVLSRGSSSIDDSLEGKWGSISVAETNSVSSPKSETTVQSYSKPIHREAQGKSDDFEPPSFITLVRSDREVDKVAVPSFSEPETVHHSKSVSLQAGWFPSLTHIVNESEGRKKNEDVIAKVTNWKENPSKLKNLDPKSKQVPAAKKDNHFVSSVRPEVPKVGTSQKEYGTSSPANYSTMMKKKKKKGKPHWVPFCCSSVNRDL